MENKKCRCCFGIDVRKNNVTVCILPPAVKREVEASKTIFRMFTRDFKRLRNRLKDCTVTDIAMESTGSIGKRLTTSSKIISRN